jgi:SAM-dependent methyltransferase
MPTTARHPDANRWDRRYAAERDAWLERKPRRLLQDYAQFLPVEGLALDAAAGVGTNSLFLARRGLRVIALDISEFALQLGKARARAESLPLDAAVWDLSIPWLPSACFDIIINFHFLERATFPAYRQALKPGSLLFFETFLKQDDGLPHPPYYLNQGELLSAFEDYEILHWEESSVPAGQSHPERGTAQLVARKPAIQAG